MEAVPHSKKKWQGASAVVQVVPAHRRPSAAECGRARSLFGLACASVSRARLYGR